MNYPIELKTRIYEHIGTVQKHLGELPPDEQREILQALETHIYDALESRSSGTPGIELLEAIIAELDPPDSYGSAPLIAPPNRSPLSSGRKVIFISFMGILCLLFIAFWLADPFSSGWMSASNPEIDTQADTTSHEEPQPAKSLETSESGTNITRRRVIPPPPRNLSVMEGPIGKWTAVDCVSNISDFDPRKQTWQGELQLKELQLMKDGTTDKPWFTWKDGKLFHSGDQTEAGFMIAKIDRKEYLFLEWMSGDVINKGKKPKYYVFRRGAYIDPATPKIIVEGIGWDQMKLGATAKELVSEFGEPDSLNTSTMIWNKLGIISDVSRSDGVSKIRFYKPFNGATSKGINIGSTEADVLKAYGNPDHISQHRGLLNMQWYSGIGVDIDSEGGVTQITIYAPRKPESTSR